MSNNSDAEVDSGYQRLEGQIKYYDGSSIKNKRMFKALKTATLATSVSIPVVSGLAAYAPSLGPLKTGIFAGILGATIALLEGIQGLNQYHQNWISYRATAEALRHEKYLYLSKAGPYATARDQKILLAERVEALVSQEQAKWTQTQQTPKGGQEKQ
jgi:hypothetical protein